MLVDSGGAWRSVAAIRIRSSAAAAAVLRMGGPFVSNSTLTAAFLGSASGLPDCRTGRACDTALSTYAQNYVSTCHLSLCVSPPTIESASPPNCLCANPIELTNSSEITGLEAELGCWRVIERVVDRVMTGLKVVAPRACPLSRPRFEQGSAGILIAMNSSPRETGGNRRLSELVEARKPDIRVLAERYGISNVRIFGSVARGDSHARSDIDFLVDIPREATLFDLSRFRRELAALLGVDVDVVSSRALLPRDRDVLEEAIGL